MQRTILILTAIAISTVTTDNKFIPDRHQQTALCIQTIVQQYFTKGRTVLVSMPSDEKPNGRSLSPQPNDNNRALVSFALTKLHEDVSWPLRVNPPKITLDAGIETTHSYIILTWRQPEDTDVMETLKSQVINLQDAEGVSWNPRGKFLVVVADSDGVSPRNLGLRIYAELWKEHFIIDSTILIADHDNYVRINGSNYSEELREATFDLYTGFPNERGRCGNIKDVTLLDQWNLHNETFVHNTNIFPIKTTNNFHGCKIRVTALGIPPYIIFKGKSTDSDGNVYKLGGLAVHNLLLAVDKMNVTAVFLKPTLRLSLMEILYKAADLGVRMSDIVIGIVPLQAAIVSALFQPTISYEYTSLKWFFPCPQPFARMQKVINTYQLPVWLTMATVYILIAILWWGLANWTNSSVKDSRTFKTLSYCLYNAWAVSMGVSATNTPNIWKFRFLFLVYVCYCFAMSTVFQGFFTSYLVEPGYGKKFETFDELLHSRLSYGYNLALEGCMTGTSYSEHHSFPNSRREDCTDIEECTRQIVNNAQLCTISLPRISEYFAIEMGVRDASKSLCTLEENLFTIGLISVLNNGSPFLNRLNVLTRRSLEGGLLDRYWAQLIWIKSLRSKMRGENGEENFYFVFSLSHLSPAFCVLGFGYALSSAVFLAEIFFKWITK